MPWETEYGYAQVVRAGGRVWLSRQLGHDADGVLAEGIVTKRGEALLQSLIQVLKIVLT